VYGGRLGDGCIDMSLYAFFLSLTLHQHVRYVGPFIMITVTIKKKSKEVFVAI